MKNPKKTFEFNDASEWRTWLQDNHANQSEAWLVILRSKAARPGVYYEEAVEEAVCFGWIDGVMKSVDDLTYYLRFSPRKSGSIWSLSNIERAQRLIAEGRMTESGMKKVREARENGEWEATLAREDTSNLPDDLSEALDKDAEAMANFEKYPASQVKMFLYWIGSAKTEVTRKRRIQKTVEMAANNKRLG